MDEDIHEFKSGDDTLCSDGASSDDSSDDSPDDSPDYYYAPDRALTPFSMEECIDAMNGRVVPQRLTDPAFGRSGPRQEFISTMRGIRHSFDFAMSQRIVQLCASERYPALNRTRNARLIMSNIIPEFDTTTEDGRNSIPYCIWYPDVAAMETYEELARRYPGLRYHVGRACAVAGYTALYRSLDLLPDVSIAEEARDNGNLAIFEDIVSSRIRYRVMDDYTRSVNLEDPSFPVFLNGDAALRSSLERTTDVRETHHDGLNITEDYNVGEASTGHLVPVPPDSADVELLYSPLPPDLPALVIDKDVLILMAAYEGNVDRYSRLRRPYFLKGEKECAVRGVYHNTSFAKWWERELVGGRRGADYVKAAIAARFIMNDDVDFALENKNAFPDMFWYPKFPGVWTLRTLATHRPDKSARILQACIAADYEDLYDEIKDRVVPDLYLWKQAKHSGNLHYRTDLERRAAEAGIDIEATPTHQGPFGEWCTFESAFEEGTGTVVPWPEISWIMTSYRDGPYDGTAVSAAEIELYISVPEELKWTVMRGEYPIDIVSARDLREELAEEKRVEEQRREEEQREHEEQQEREEQRTREEQREQGEKREQEERAEEMSSNGFASEVSSV